MISSLYRLRFFELLCICILTLQVGVEARGQASTRLGVVRQSDRRLQKVDSGSESHRLSVRIAANSLEDESGPQHDQKLDIVIAHYEASNLQETSKLWRKVLALPNIKALNPYVYVYCQNTGLQKHQVQKALAPILLRGEVIMMDNRGREGRVYLHHIAANYDRLADHTLFSQDVRIHEEEDAQHRDPAPERLKTLFRQDTGVLALSMTLNETCDDLAWSDNAWRFTTLMYQTYAMVVRKYCPPDGFVAFYKGQFVVSRRRVRAKPQSLYQELMSMVEAPSGHWVHRLHNHPGFGTPVNPFLGHVYERVWSLLFDCHDPNVRFVERCKACDEARWQNCPKDACQCLDSTQRRLANRNESHVESSLSRIIGLGKQLGG